MTQRMLDRPSVRLISEETKYASPITEKSVVRDGREEVPVRSLRDERSIPPCIRSTFQFLTLRSSSPKPGQVCREPQVQVVRCVEGRTRAQTPTRRSFERNRSGTPSPESTPQHEDAPSSGARTAERAGRVAQLLVHEQRQRHQAHRHQDDRRRPVTSMGLPRRATGSPRAKPPWLPWAIPVKKARYTVSSTWSVPSTTVGAVAAEHLAGER